MLAKKIIPCLDLKDGRVVKGVNFVNLVDAGDPVEIAKAYSQQGADEIVLLDITASLEKRKTTMEVIKKIAGEISIPIIVGGGINTLDDIERILNLGASKVSISSAAVKNPELIKEAAEKFGSKSIIVAIDAKKRSDGRSYDVYINGGRVNTAIDAVEWAKKACELGAGELLVTSIDSDGMKEGYDISLYKLLKESVNLPIIASGGAGKKEDFKEVFEGAGVESALAASLFHYNEINIIELKDYLKENNIPVRVG